LDNDVAASKDGGVVVVGRPEGLLALNSINYMVFVLQQNCKAKE